LFVAKKDAASSAMPSDGKIDTIVGRETEFKGTLTSSGIIRIDGKVDGEIIHQGDIAVGESGSVTADIKARNITVAGTVSGNVDASGKLELLSSARLCGDISVATLVIGEGAVFKGSSEMKANEKTTAAARAGKAQAQDKPT
jgi:cytoskeletal protein CcmA (bactofilin family)